MIISKKDRAPGRVLNQVESNGGYYAFLTYNVLPVMKPQAMFFDAVPQYVRCELFDRWVCIDVCKHLKCRCAAVGQRIGTAFPVGDSWAR
jgi:hypothetical protein